MTTSVFLNSALTGYVFKLIIAVVLTPLIYLGHHLIDKYLGDEDAQITIKNAAEESLQHRVGE